MSNTSYLWIEIFEMYWEVIGNHGLGFQKSHQIYPVPPPPQVHNGAINLNFSCFAVYLKMLLEILLSFLSPFAFQGHFYEINGSGVITSYMSSL